MCYFMADGIAIWEILFKYQISKHQPLTILHPTGGYSICHLAIPSANTFNIVVITAATILAITSAKTNFGRQ